MVQTEQLQVKKLLQIKEQIQIQIQILQVVKPQLELEEGEKFNFINDIFLNIYLQ